MSEHEPHLSPPDLGRPGENGRPRSLAPLFILICFITLLIGVGTVLFLLPGKQSKQADNLPPAGTAIQPTAPPAARQTEKPLPEPGRDNATELLEAMLALQVQAKAETISSWGGKIYQVILDTAARADNHFAEHNFQEAAATYRIAISDLNDLLDSKQAIFQTALQEAQQALTAENSSEASRLFAQALAINPADSEAKNGAQRATSLDTVIAMFKDATSLEESGKPAAAEAKFIALLEIDGAYQPGREGLTRVQRKIEEQTFQAEMGSFLVAIESGNLTQARSSFESLKKIRNNDEQVLQAGRILADKEESAHIASLRKKAEKQDAAEQWQDALATYKKILTIAPEVLFAVNGQTLAVKRLKLDTALTETINRPHRLQDDKQRTDATELLVYAQRIDPKGPRLAAQINRLKELITLAGTLVSVTLESDNRTDVTIYHVGRMGRFFSRQVDLKPGTYSIVGTRLGYRDIRKSVKITLGSKANNFFIQCKEPI